MGDGPGVAVTLDQDVVVPRRDGTRLRADVYRPVGGQHPTLVMRLPYDKRRAQTYWYASPAWYATQGYAVVVEDVRGRFVSEGNFAPMVNEVADTVDLLGWAAGQPWSNGRVGMYGYSYAGLLQLLAASSSEAAPLNAIAPALAPPGLGEGCLRVNGVTAASFLVGWAAELGGLDLEIPDATAMRRLVSRPFGDLAGKVPDSARGWAEIWLAQNHTDPYWTQPALTPAYDAITVPVLHIGGWYDTFRRAGFDHYAMSREGRQDAAGRDRLAVGAWTHHPRHTRSRNDELSSFWSIDDLQIAFFDEILKGAPRQRSETVRVAILNSDDSWSGDGWPPAGTRELRLHLFSGGRAAGLDGDGALSDEESPWSAPDFLHYDHAGPVPTLGGDDCGDPAVVEMGPRDQFAVERRSDVLLYTSAPMKTDTVVAGDPCLTLHFESSDEQSQWVARLCVVGGDGVSRNLVETVCRVDGETGPRRLDLSFGSIAFRIAAGQRLRLQLTNGSSPRWESLRDAAHRPTVSRSTVFHDPDHPSVLSLPQLS